MYNGYCTACDAACAECSGTGFTNCQSCNTGYSSGGPGICYLTCATG